MNGPRRAVLRYCVVGYHDDLLSLSQRYRSQRLGEFPSWVLPPIKEEVRFWLGHVV
jgi:hypothetical protein